MLAELDGEWMHDTCVLARFAWLFGSWQGCMQHIYMHILGHTARNCIIFLPWYSQFVQQSCLWWYLEAVGDGFACGFGIPRMTAEAVIIGSGNARRIGWRMDAWYLCARTVCMAVWIMARVHAAHLYAHTGTYRKKLHNFSSMILPVCPAKLPVMISGSCWRRLCLWVWHTTYDGWGSS